MSAALDAIMDFLRDNIDNVILGVAGVAFSVAVGQLFVYAGKRRP